VLALLQKIVPLIAVEPLVGTFWRADEKGLRILGQQTP